MSQEEKSILSAHLLTAISKEFQDQAASLEQREKLLTERESRVKEYLKVEGSPTEIINVYCEDKIFKIPSDTLCAKESKLQSLICKKDKLTIDCDLKSFSMLLEFFRYGTFLDPEEYSRRDFLHAKAVAKKYECKAFEEYLDQLDTSTNTNTKANGKRANNSAGERLGHWSASQVTGSGQYKSWDVEDHVGKELGIERNQADQTTFTVAAGKGGFFRITVMVNGASSGGNYDYITLFINNNAICQAYVGLDAGYTSTFFLSKVVKLDENSTIKVYQNINSNNVQGVIHNTIQFERIVD